MITEKMIEELARAWASIDGKADKFDACKADPVLEDELGHYAGYIAEAQELLRRSPTVSAAIAAGEPVKFTVTDVQKLELERLADEAAHSAFYPVSSEAQVRVKVKPLEWQKRFSSEYLSRAETIIGVYRVWSYHEAKGEWYWSIDGLREHIASDEESAKSAAQADYEHRIRSALTIPEQGETPPSPETNVRVYSEDDLRTIGRAWRTPSVRRDFEAETGMAPLATGAGLNVEAQRQSGHAQDYTERFHAWVIAKDASSDLPDDVIERAIDAYHAAAGTTADWDGVVAALQTVLSQPLQPRSTPPSPSPSTPSPRKDEI